MYLSLENFSAHTIIRVNDQRIDAAVAIRFKDEMRVLCTKAANRVVLDLSAVDFIDSSGLGAIVAALNQTRDGQTLELAALNPNVAKVFHLTRLDTIFTIHPTPLSDELANAS